MGKQDNIEKNNGVDSVYRLLIADYVIREYLCNLKCDYCWSSPNQTIGKKTSVKSIDAALNIMHSIKEKANPLILKLSGGELACLGQDCLILFREAASIFPRVQVLTNGIDFKIAWIDEISQFANVYMQFSLDGHTMQMNVHRFKNTEYLERTILAIRRASYYKHVEINTVLTKENVDGLLEFANYLVGIGSNLTLYPFPVRGKKVFFPDVKSVKNFIDLVAGSIALQNIMPSKWYLHHLAEFIGQSYRTSPCRIPLVVRGFFETGDTQICPCEDLGSTENIYNYDEVVNQTQIQKHLRSYPWMHKKCVNCFTHYEVLNNILDDMAGADIIHTFPILQGVKEQAKSIIIKARQTTLP